MDPSPFTRKGAREEAAVRFILRLAPVLALSLPLLGAPAPQAQEQDDGVFIDEAKKDFLDKIKRTQQQGEWRALFELYQQAITKLQQKLVRPNATSNVYIGVVEFLNREFSKLTAEAPEY